ncbi:MAG: hypothetical protein AAF430_26625 [Myxococcota bacterium]
MGEERDPVGPIEAFRRFAVLHGFARSWLWAATAEASWLPGLVGAALIATVAFLLLWIPQRAWLAPFVALPALLLQLVLTFPLTDNHFFLELYAVVLLALAGPRDEAASLALTGLRSLAVIVLFVTGLQKVLYGQYFDGQFLAFMVSQSERFALAFAPLVSEAQHAALRALDPMRTGQGPFRADGWLLPAASNAVWILELALPGLIVWTRSRAFAVAVALALVALIQLGAREIGFALFFGNLLLLFTANGNRLALIPSALVYAYGLVAVTTGTLPFDPGWL